ncbi:unnamed protein product [Didymodactylos carnosus]|uniref:Uncharacterized protein n=1 Tax=Didymodactylos carnosus TaxID=1234261 RepID=A0A815A028_9BILA|nr:unnamed protein product [Didymodactylos carnosus]CAF4017511.1 unnamed protein product [Didymodactylos carnosus]
MNSRRSALRKFNQAHWVKRPFHPFIKCRKLRVFMCFARTKHSMKHGRKNKDAAASSKSKLLMSTMPPTLDKQEASFMYFQLFIDILLRMDNSYSNALQELAENVRKQCEGSTVKLDNIKEFEENYSAEKAIWWYTQNHELLRSVDKNFEAEEKRIQDNGLKFQSKNETYNVQIKIENIMKGLKVRMTEPGLGGGQCLMYRTK